MTKFLLFSTVQYAINNLELRLNLTWHHQYFHFYRKIVAVGQQGFQPATLPVLQIYHAQLREEIESRL
jgi:hypothetical protein